MCVCVCVHKCIHRDDYLAEDKQGLSLSVGWSGDILFFVRVSLVLLVFVLGFVYWFGCSLPFCSHLFFSFCECVCVCVSLCVLSV